jgi:hypothetical protein
MGTVLVMRSRRNHHHAILYARMGSPTSCTRDVMSETTVIGQDANVAGRLCGSGLDRLILYPSSFSSCGVDGVSPLLSPALTRGEPVSLCAIRGPPHSKAFISRYEQGGIRQVDQRRGTEQQPGRFRHLLSYQPILQSESADTVLVQRARKPGFVFMPVSGPPFSAGNAEEGS